MSSEPAPLQSATVEPPPAAVSAALPPVATPADAEQSEQPRTRKPLLDLNKGVRVTIEQDDPNSPLYSVKSFEELNLHPDLLKGVYNMGFSKPSKIQENALPTIISDPKKNLIGQAQSGTGKTAAFTLGMLSRVDPTQNFPQAVCLSPTRELSRQIQDVVTTMGQFTSITTCLVVKEANIPRPLTAHILIGTPGKLLDLIHTRQFDPRRIRIFVLDEADQMLDQGQSAPGRGGPQQRSSMGEQSVQLKRYMPVDAQFILFSATFRDDVRAFAERIVGRERGALPVVKIELKREQLTLDKIQQLFIKCNNEQDKFKVLCDIYAYSTVGQSIIFVQTRDTASRLSELMRRDGFKVSLLHGDLMPLDRDECIDQFRSGKTRVLITTNVLSRGIDIEDVMLVINYDLPMDQYNRPDFETYLHRIGRSGRFGRRGIAINFVHDQRTILALDAISQHFKRDIHEFPADKLDELQQKLADIQLLDKQDAAAALKEEDDARRALDRVKLDGPAK
eukprot:TRINITY_DN3476_c0_g1_i1.p1 TRINITY_DN3476_c0_g1~~TRINITY_DN3476_c0_g1_i1.p1  ORF type:complete len:506 (-),score=157.31 TRINITY_DN3476_c0_g1_i1:91-1608(-)